MAFSPLPDGVSRRDFINGILVAAGGAMANPLLPRGAEACVETGVGVCDGPIGMDPRALRGGNLPTAFKVAHWLRDDRLTFSVNSVRVMPGQCEPTHGHFSILPDDGPYDVIVAGRGTPRTRWCRT